MTRNIKMKIQMRKRVIQAISLLLMGAMMIVACKKDNTDLIIGKWANTAQSYEITIAGQEYIPAGYIAMEFTTDSVWVVDSRVDCLAEWHPYTLSKVDGKLLLEIDGGCHAGQFVVEELSENKLVLAPESSSIDWDFRYIMTCY